MACKNGHTSFGTNQINPATAGIETIPKITLTPIHLLKAPSSEKQEREGTKLIRARQSLQICYNWLSRNRNSKHTSSKPAALKEQIKENALQQKRTINTRKQMKQKGRTKVKLVIKKPITKDWETQIKEMIIINPLWKKRAEN